ncbi:MAG: hypothetical protein LC734_08270 [Acidobacteria bacterium]|nr:hypothetical protein [Acidobacteriota bacterium]
MIELLPTITNAMGLANKLRESGDNYAGNLRASCRQRRRTLKPGVQPKAKP